MVQAVIARAAGWRPALARARPTEFDRRHALVAAAIVLGFLVRFAPLAGASFPLNDGGLFAQMVEDLRANGYAVPGFSTYNGGIVPFAYPPLGFYLTALLSELPGIDTAKAMQILPLLASTGTIAAFYLLARRMLGSMQAAALAPLIFALLPRAFLWENMGGGITRAPGLLFAVLATALLYDLYARNQRRSLLPAMALTVLAVLSHPEMGWFTAYSGALFLAFHRDHLRAKLVHTAILGAGIIVLTAPWWANVLAQHGLEPFLAAAQTGDWSLATLTRLLVFDFTEGPLLDVFSVLALIGVFWHLRRGSYLIPAWLLVMFVLDPRKATTLAMLPLAMLAGSALVEVVLPALGPTLGRARDALRPGEEPAAPPGRGPAAHAPAGSLTARRWTATAFVVTVFLYALVAATIAGSLRPSFVWSPASPLPQHDRAAMAWVAEHAPDDSRFAVVSDALLWGEDRVSEWFPTLAARESLATPQGSEWLGDGAYDDRIQVYEALQDCRGHDAACLAAWSDAYGLGYTHIYISERDGSALGPPIDRLAACCGALRLSLAGSPTHRLVYEAGRVQIFERVTGMAAQ